MAGASARVLTGTLLMLAALHRPAPLEAQTSIGTWVRRGGGNPGAPTVTMTIEACCGGGRRVTYRSHGPAGDQVMTIDSPMDGTPAPILVHGKPSGETMAIRRIDARHSETVVAMNGKPYGTSRATLSANNDTLTVENLTELAGSHGQGMKVEVWVRQ